MIIKKFIGKTEEEAIAAAKKELGDGVVIMNVKNVKRKGLFALFAAKQVEVTVALEEESVRYQPKEASTQDMQTKSLSAKVGSNSQNNSSENIERKLDSLQTLLESQIKRNEEAKTAESKPASERDAITGEAKEPLRKEVTSKLEDTEKREETPEQEKFIRLLYNTMLDNEVDEKYANQILEDIEKTKKPNMPIDYILANIYQKMILKFGKSEGITGAEKGPKVVLFLGPTGVGKTTTIAKIASRYSVEQKKKVVLLTSDTYRIAAAEQLRTYANILEVPFRVIYTEEEFGNAVNDFREYDYIFVDTAGHSHQNNEQLQRMKELLDSLKDVAEYQTFLVLSATTKYHDLIKISEKYRAISDYQLIFTKLDETECIGNLFNVKLHTDAAIAFTAYGQNVPDDIEIFNPQKTVKQLLGGKNQ